MERTVLEVSGACKPERLAELWEKVKIYSHYPKPGIAFVDLGSILADGEMRREVQDYFNLLFDPDDYDVILAIAVRGVGIGQCLADAYGKSMVIARKPEVTYDETANGPKVTVHSKVPSGNIVRAISSSEYGKDVPLEFDGSLVHAGQRVLIVDDLFATGGTAESLANALEKKCGAIAIGVAVYTQLDYLSDVAKPLKCPVRAVFHQKTKPTLPEGPTVQKRIRCSL